MSVPPAILDLRVTSADKSPVHIWLPLFLLWPVALALVVVSLVLTILVDVALLLFGRPYHHYTILLAGSFAALAHTRGMVIRINDSESAIDMTFQ